MLIPCKDCGKQISSEASACPNCGRPVAESKKSYVNIQEHQIEKKTKADTTSAIIMVLVLLAIVALLIWNEVSNDDKEKAASKPTNVVSNTKTPTPTPTKPLTEEEYKNACVEYYYNDIFFGENDLEGKYVKLDLFLTQSMYFKTENWYSEQYKEMYEIYKMQRNFFECSVLRKEEDSYAGPGKMKIWFSDNYSIDSDDYNTGEKVIIYGEVVSWSDNTMDGYNSVIVIPKYIERK